jgi:hypothetical protein
MSTILWLTAGVAVFDGFLLTLLYLVFRRLAPLGASGILAIGGGMAGFVGQALMCYSGPFLILQLATIAGAFGICVWAPRKRRPLGNAGQA